MLVVKEVLLSLLTGRVSFLCLLLARWKTQAFVIQSMLSLFAKGECEIYVHVLVVRLIPVDVQLTIFVLLM